MMIGKHALLGMRGVGGKEAGGHGLIHYPIPTILTSLQFASILTVIQSTFPKRAYAGFSEGQMEQVTHAVSNAVQQVDVEHGEAHSWVVHVLEGWEKLGIWGIPLLTIIVLFVLWQFKRPISRALVGLFGKFTGGDK